MIKALRRYLPEQLEPGELSRLMAMMGLFFLVVCAVGILRPIKNALALDGLGSTDFYKVYLVSAAVVLFVPIYNKLADRFPWRWLIPAVALSFAIELVLFRVFYVEGSTAFGMLFYGWYDLFAAALVSQFFMATQLFFNARSAKQAYPLVIAGGSVGATLGGGITGFFSERVGTPNLLLVAAVLITIFSFALPVVWGKEPVSEKRRKEPQDLDAGELRSLWRNRQVRLIAVSVLLTIIVKQFVDYQFNTMTKEVFVDRDAISAFQGKFNAVTQWLPVLALVLLQPALKRWGVGLAVTLLPIAMLITNIGLEIWWGLWAAVIAKGAETSLRYSTERAAREILYVPVPEEIKLKAKAYIDVAIEKGIGKVVSAGLIFLLLLVMPYRQITLVGIVLSIIWLLFALAMREEYVRTLARSIEGRFASLRGGFASIAEPTTRAALSRALRAQEPQQLAFALDLMSQAGTRDLREYATEIGALVDHPTEGVRIRALQVAARAPGLVEPARIRAHLIDRSSDVREAAVEVMLAGGAVEPVLSELLASDDARVRTAALACVARGAVATDLAQWITRDYIMGHLAQANAGDREARFEVALAAGALRGDAEAIELVRKLAEDRNPHVANAAIQSGGKIGAPQLYNTLLHALGVAETRSAARVALSCDDEAIAPRLGASLLDPATPDRVRRQIPAVLSNIGTPATIDALIHSYLAPETDQLLDFRTLKALSKLRQRDPNLVFDRADVITAIKREVEAANTYDRARAGLAAETALGPGGRLLARALDEARAERLESTFRWLGLIFPPQPIRDCHQTLLTAPRQGRANAVEWLDQTLGHDLFDVIAPLFRESATGPARELGTALQELENDNDAWIAALADWTATELAPHIAASNPSRGGSMDLIEKVFLLQQVDLLQGARSSHLALLASIGRLQDIERDTTLIRQNEPTRAMYVVVRGAVELRSATDQVMIARDNAAFGTWALIDQAPSMVSAVTIEPTRVLCIEREDFHDLLNENPELALGLLEGLARRVRTLVA